MYSYIHIIHVVYLSSIQPPRTSKTGASFRPSTTRTRSCSTLLTSSSSPTLSTSKRPARHYNIVQHSVTHCNIVQHSVTHCNILQHKMRSRRKRCVNQSQHTATHRNSLQPTEETCKTKPYTHRCLVENMQ